MKILENHLVEQADGTRYHMCDDIVTDLGDTYMGEDASIGDIYRASQKEHGRCISKVYIGDGIPVGWVFVKREKYEDDPKQSYLHETWISLLDKDETVRNIEYHRIDQGR